MGQDNLSDKLRNLDEELRRAQPADEQTRQVVSQLQANVQPFIEEPSGDHSHHFDSVREELDHAALHLQVEHPTLAAALASVLDELGRVGI